MPITVYATRLVIIVPYTPKKVKSFFRAPLHSAAVVWWVLICGGCALTLRFAHPLRRNSPAGYRYEFASKLALKGTSPFRGGSTSLDS